MPAVLIIGTTLVLPSLLLLLRMVLFRHPARRSQFGKVVNLKQGNGRPDPGSPDEWPSNIGAKESSDSCAYVLSEEDRIQIAVMQERIFRLLR